MLQPVQQGWSCHAEHGERGWALRMSQLDGGDIQHPLLQPPPTPEGAQAPAPPRQGTGLAGSGCPREGREGEAAASPAAELH